MKKSKNKSNLSIVNDYLQGNRPFTQIGWDPNLIDKKPGEIWVDSAGKTWIQHAGYKKRINKAFKINPNDTRLLCSVCGCDVKWGNHLDDKIFPKTGRCYDCNIGFETKLKHEGKFVKYEQVKIFKNQLGFCKDVKSKLEETIDHLEKSTDDIIYINEDGSKEVWQDTTKSRVLKDAKEDYAECLAAIVRIETSLNSLNETVNL